MILYASVGNQGGKSGADVGTLGIYCACDALFIKFYNVYNYHYQILLIFVQEKKITVKLLITCHRWIFLK